MKTASLLVVLAITLAVMGTGFSYSDYGESSQTLTLTTVRSYTTTELSVTRTSTTIWLARGQVIEIEAVGEYYCTKQRSFSLNLTAGQLHVSYSTNGSAVNFWMLTERDYQRLTGAQYCEDIWGFQAADFSVSKSGSADFTVQVPSSGTYYLVFENADKHNAAMITLNIDRGVQETQFTMTSVRTVFSTQQTVVTSENTTPNPTITRTTSTRTEALATSQSWTGYVLPLTFGAIVAVAVIVAVLLMRRKKGVQSPPESAVSTKFCEHCGAKIPPKSEFCQECGKKLA